eukprot:7520241-Pyramimonas_sp.AAC.1
MIQPEAVETGEGQNPESTPCSTPAYTSASARSSIHLMLGFLVAAQALKDCAEGCDCTFSG